jgi:hypothetical protein
VSVEQDIIKILKEKKMATSRFVTKDFSQLVQMHKGVRPHQVMEALKGCLHDYPEGSKERRSLEALINTIGLAQTEDDLRGKSFIEHIGGTTKHGELTATFLVYQFRMGKFLDSHYEVYGFE